LFGAADDEPGHPRVAAEAANTVASVVSAATTPIVAAENHPGWQTGSDKGLCSM
jgi:hypothetical protein